MKIGLLEIRLNKNIGNNREHSVLTLEEFQNDISKYKLEFSVARSLEELYKGLPYSNGCGAKGGIKFPDTMYFISVCAACVIHDIEWKLSTSYKELLLSNENFDNNLKKITDFESMNDAMRWLRRLRVGKYVNGVELHGTDAYAIERGFI